MSIVREEAENAIKRLLGKVVSTATADENLKNTQAVSNIANAMHTYETVKQMTKRD